MPSTGLQACAVALIVGACLAYAVWTLMPGALRRPIAARLLGALPWPGAVARRLRKAATASTGCGCDGCDKPPPHAERPATQPLTFHPRPRR